MGYNRDNCYEVNTYPMKELTNCAVISTDAYPKGRLAKDHSGRMVGRMFSYV